MRTTLGSNWTSFTAHPFSGQILTSKRRNKMTSTEITPGLNIRPRKDVFKLRLKDVNVTNLCRVEYDNGGLQAPDIVSQYMTLRLAWLARSSNSKPWCSIATTISTNTVV